MRKIGLILLSIVLLLSSFPASILGNEPVSSSAITYDLPNPNDFEHITVQKKQTLSQEHGIEEEELQSLLDEGYTLVEVESALLETKKEKISLDRALDRVS